MSLTIPEVQRTLRVFILIFDPHVIRLSFTLLEMGEREEEEDDGTKNCYLMKHYISNINGDHEETFRASKI